MPEKIEKNKSEKELLIQDRIKKLLSENKIENREDAEMIVYKEINEMLVSEFYKRVCEAFKESAIDLSTSAGILEFLKKALDTLLVFIEQGKAGDIEFNEFGTIFAHEYLRQNLKLAGFLGEDVNSFIDTKFSESSWDIFVNAYKGGSQSPKKLPNILEIEAHSKLNQIKNLKDKMGEEYVRMSEVARLMFEQLNHFAYNNGLLNILSGKDFLDINYDSEFIEKLKQNNPALSNMSQSEVESLLFVGDLKKIVEPNIPWEELRSMLTLIGHSKAWRATNFVDEETIYTNLLRNQNEQE